MVGGKVIENLLTNLECGRPVRRLWCVDGADECAVYAHPVEALSVQPGDSIWWQSGKIMWSREGEFSDVPIDKIGFSFDPRRAEARD